jgi:hypothetical protein
MDTSSIANYQYSLEITRSEKIPQTGFPFLDLKSVTSRSLAIKRVQVALKEICDETLIQKIDKNQIILVPSAVLAFILSEIEKQESQFGE